MCTYVPDNKKEKKHIAKDLKDNWYPSQHVNKNWCTTSNPRQLSSSESHGSDPIHSAPLQVYPMYPSPAKGPYLLLVALHPQAYASKP